MYRFRIYSVFLFVLVWIEGVAEKSIAQDIGPIPAGPWISNGFNGSYIGYQMQATIEGESLRSYQNPKGLQCGFVFDVKTSNFKARFGDTPHESDLLNAGLSVQSLRQLTPDHLASLESYLTAINRGLTTVNDPLEGAAYEKAEKAGFIARPNDAVFNAMQNVVSSITRNENGPHLGNNCTVADAKLVSQFMQTNFVLNQIKTFLYETPASNRSNDTVADQVRATASGLLAVNPFQATDRLRSMQLGLMSRAPTRKELFGLYYLDGYLSGRKKGGEASVCGLLDRPEILLATNYLLSDGIVKADSGMELSEEYDIPASVQSVAEKGGEEWDWSRLGGRFDKICESRTEDQILIDDYDWNQGLLKQITANESGYTAEEEKLSKLGVNVDSLRSLTTPMADTINKIFQGATNNDSKISAAEIARAAKAGWVALPDQEVVDAFQTIVKSINRERHITAPSNWTQVIEAAQTANRYLETNNAMRCLRSIVLDPQRQKAVESYRALLGDGGNPSLIDKRKASAGLNTNRAPTSDEVTGFDQLKKYFTQRETDGEVAAGELLRSPFLQRAVGFFLSDGKNDPQPPIDRDESAGSQNTEALKNSWLDMFKVANIQQQIKDRADAENGNIDVREHRDPKSNGNGREGNSRILAPK